MGAVPERQFARAVVGADQGRADAMFVGAYPDGLGYPWTIGNAEADADADGLGGLKIGAFLKRIAAPVVRVAAPVVSAVVPVVGAGVSRAATALTQTARTQASQTAQQALAAAQRTPQGQAVQQTAITNALQQYAPYLLAAGAAILLLSRKRRG